MTTDLPIGAQLPDTQPGTQAGTQPVERELAVRLAASIVAVEGVDRLHPTLRRAVASIAAGAVRSAPPLVARLARPGSPGLDVRQNRDGRVDVVVDLSTRPGATALAVGRTVRRIVRETLQEAGHRPGSILITVLDVVPDDSGSDESGSDESGVTHE